MENLLTPFIDFDHLDSLGCDVGGVVMFDCERAKLSVSDEDRKRFNDLPVGNDNMNIYVEDKLSGRKIEVARADCGLGCFCAAVVIEIKQREEE